MRAISENGKLFKKIKVETVFPSPEFLLYNEFANIIESQEKQFRHFRENFRLSSNQQKVFEAYKKAPDSLQVYLMYGSTGSGKTMTALALLTEVALQNPGAIFLIVRKTYVELKDSLIPDFCKFMDKHKISYHYVANPVPNLIFPNGAEFRFRSEIKSNRSKQEKADSLGSTKYYGAYINEADNISFNYYNTLFSRMRQRDVIDKKPFILMDVNPPPEDHWIYREFFRDRDTTSEDTCYRKFQMLVYDNREFVSSAYIKDLEDRYKPFPSLYKKFVEGTFSPTVKGRPVFEGVFSPILHVSKQPLKWNPSYPMIRCWDFGFRHPACLIMQDDPEENTVKIFRATVGSFTFLAPFATRILQHCEQEYPGAFWTDYCDATGTQRRDTGSGHENESSVGILSALGLSPKFKKSHIDYGLQLMRQTLSEISQTGRGVVQIDESEASSLIDALAYGYCYDPDKHGDDKKRIVPIKDGRHDHIVDCFRYGLDNLKRFTTSLSRNIQPVPRKLGSELWKMRSGVFVADSNKYFNALYNKQNINSSYSFGGLT